VKNNEEQNNPFNTINICSFFVRIEHLPNMPGEQKMALSLLTSIETLFDWNYLMLVII